MYLAHNKVFYFWAANQSLGKYEQDKQLVTEGKFTPHVLQYYLLCTCFTVSPNTYSVLNRNNNKHHR
jgi:hypothetical protein